jgi:hypothetical protein
MADGKGVFSGCTAAILDDSAAGFASGGAGSAGETVAVVVAAGAAAGFAVEVAETGFSAPRAGAVETPAIVFCPAAAVTEFEDPEAEAGETFG